MEFEYQQVKEATEVVRHPQIFDVHARRVQDNWWLVDEVGAKAIRVDQIHQVSVLAPKFSGEPPAPQSLRSSSQERPEFDRAKIVGGEQIPERPKAKILLNQMPFAYGEPELDLREFLEFLDTLSFSDEDAPQAKPQSVASTWIPARPPA